MWNGSTTRCHFRKHACLHTTCSLAANHTSHNSRIPKLRKREMLKHKHLQKSSKPANTHQHTPTHTNTHHHTPTHTNTPQHTPTHTITHTSTHQHTPSHTITHHHT